MIQKYIYNKLKNIKLDIIPANNDEARQLIEIFKEYNLVYKEDADEPNVESNTTRFIYIDGDDWFYDYDDEDTVVDEMITYQEFISKYLTEDINLIDDDLEENEISIQDELILESFGDFCKERL